MAPLRNLLSKQECLKKLEEEPFKRITLSFYRYTKLEWPEELRDRLYKDWSALGVFGRVYLASEGINAQISVPEPRFKAFQSHLEAYEPFRGMVFNIGLEQRESFYKLILKVKKQIFTDGLPEDSYDLSQVGNHLTAEEFNQALLEAGTVAVDMRNFYESRIGRFEGAICPDSNTFKEELRMALDALKGKEDKKLLLYCTGGIRCEKASAYLRHHGFKDVNQLRGGIISYAHEIRQKGLDSRFRGRNYVFDERISEPVTSEVLSTCDQCEEPCDAYTNCNNAACNLLFLQCAGCKGQFSGCCSESCRSVYELPEVERRAYYARQKASDYGVYVSRIRPKLK